jgi:hypothetical protein
MQIFGYLSNKVQSFLNQLFLNESGAEALVGLEIAHVMGPVDLGKGKAGDLHLVELRDQVASSLQ